MGKQVLFASCYVDIMSKTVHHFQESLAKLLLDDELVDSSQGNLKTGACATYVFHCLIGFLRELEMCPDFLTSAL